MSYVACHARKGWCFELEHLEPRRLLSAIKVLPLGDSITASTVGHASYRFWLDKRLTLAGYDYDLVGTRWGVSDGTQMGQAPPLYTDFDQHHQSIPGYRTDHVLAEIDAWAAATLPDMVLMHLGTNDMLQSRSVAEAIANLDDIIDALRVVNPDVTIFLAKLIPSRVLNNNINALNTQIPGLATLKDTPESRVILVDQNSNYSAFIDNYDEVHPGQTGEIKMTNKWFDALVDFLPPPDPAPLPVTWLGDIDWVSATNGSGPVERNFSNGGSNANDGRAISLDGITTIKGLGTHANSEIVYTLNGQYARFRSDVGVDDEVGSGGSIVFQVFVDDVLRFDSGTMTGSSPTQLVDIDVVGAQLLKLVVTDAGNGNQSDHGDWANARLIIAPSVAASVYSFNTAPHSLAFEFTGDVSASIEADDLMLENLTTMQTVPVASIDVSYDSKTNTANFTFPGFAKGLLPSGNYRATILAGSVTQAGGHPMLDDHVFDFFFLLGDANHDGIVNLDDFNLVSKNFGESGMNYADGDLNYDGTVDLSDFNVLASAFGSTLIPPLFSSTPISAQPTRAVELIADELP